MTARTINIAINIHKLHAKTRTFSVKAGTDWKTNNIHIELEKNLLNDGGNQISALNIFCHW